MRLAVLAARAERGAISALVVFLFIALMLLAGLVVDGGNAINARARVNDDAEQAARAGANQIDEVELRQTGEVVINEAAAREAAQAYLSVQGYSADQSTVEATFNEVTVTLEDTVLTELLSMVNIDDFDVNGEATARAAIGITEEIP
jgi:Flp pilus assembly protein TadG